ncbi:MAG: type II toxin-antitoxin system VapC family toxin [Methanotrichaceae archaeon]|nr:type II toxin-antitoxin system VapC family toxin [Methanotrichaceae archaeon]
MSWHCLTFCPIGGVHTRLLSNDALHLATMKQEGLSTLASNDRDFSSVKRLQIWRP